jgi:DNA-binding MarR family transcriptional regulator
MPDAPRGDLDRFRGLVDHDPAEASISSVETSGRDRAVSSAPGRTALITGAGDVMRELMTRAVLFQDAVAKSAGLNATDMQCANLLLLYGPATPGELAGRAGVTAGGAITGALDRLERAGLVRRTRDGTDRRRVMVTADADELWRRVGPSYERIATSWNAFLDTLTDEQLEVADTVLRQASELNALEIRRLRGSDDADR